MRNKSKIIAFFLSVCLFISVFGIEAKAASGNVSVSGASGTVGSTVTVSATVSCSSGPIGSASVVLQYDPSALEFAGGSGGTNGGSGSVQYANVGDGSVTSLNFSMTFKILKEGSFSISGTADGYNFDEEQLAMSVSGGTVTGKAVTTSSSGSSGSGSSGSSTPQQDNRDKNSKLSALQVSPGTLAPAFHANTTEYTVTVPEETTEVTIAATPQSNKAKVSVSGGKELKLGPNEAKVVVTAENGSTTVYTITIMCGELEKITIAGQELLINEGFSDDQIPAGFIREKVTYNERQYEALSHEKSGMKLMSLVNETVGATYYIYNPDTQSFYNFIQIQLSEGKVVIPMPTDESEEFATNEKTEITLQDKAFEAWKVDEEFYVFKMLNADGQEVFYQYDSVDGTFQRYMGPIAEEPVVEEEPEEEKNFLETYYLYIIIGLAVLTVILAITTIYLASTRKHKHSARKRKMQKKLEKEQEKALDDEFEK